MSLSINGKQIVSFYSKVDGVDIIDAIQADGVTDLNFDDCQTTVIKMQGGGSISTVSYKKEGPSDTTIMMSMQMLELIAPKLHNKIESIKQGSDANIGEFTATLSNQAIRTFKMIIMSGYRVDKIGSEQANSMVFKLELLN
jgi:hypothetical protein